MRSLLELFCLVKDDKNPIGLSALRKPDEAPVPEETEKDDDDDMRWLKLIRD